MIRGFLAGCSLIALTVSAGAVDAYTPTPETAPWLFTGYIDLHGGFEAWHEDGTFDFFSDTYWDNANEGLFGAAGRAAIALSPAWSIQLDAWINWYSVSGHYSEGSGYQEFYDYSTSLPGFGGHLTYHTPGGSLIGILASIGDSWDGYGSAANVGIEAAHEFGNWRLYGQTGYTFGTGGEAAFDAATDWYAAGSTAYYFDPNLAVSVNGGIDLSSDNTGSGTTTFTWGARIEHKLASLPISGYLAYQGWCWDGSDPGGAATWNGTSHAFIAGVRFTFNQPTLRALNQAVGLVDMNSVYGDLPF
jgi:hypothetical protein